MKNLKKIAFVTFALLGVSNLIADAKTNQKCAEEAAAITSRAVADGWSWSYARTLGDIVYGECMDKLQNPPPAQ